MSFLEHMREVDPTGVYTLTLKLADPEQWGLTEYLPEQLEGLYELVKVTMIPSAHLHFYENSSRMGTIDAAHMRGRLKCSYQGLVLADSNGQNFNISYEIVPMEAKEYYDQHFDLLAAVCTLPLLLVVSDKFSGLQARIARVNATATASATSVSALTGAALREVQEADKRATTLQLVWQQGMTDVQQARRQRVGEEAVQILEGRVALASKAYEDALDEAMAIEEAAQRAGYAADVALVWLCCAIHGARNQGITGTRGKELVVKAAIAARQRSPRGTESPRACRRQRPRLPAEVGTTHH